MRERRPDASSPAAGLPDKQLLREWLTEANALDLQLVDAVMNGDLETVRALLDGEEGADQCARVEAEEGQAILRGSVLHVAIQQGNLEIVRILLDSGAVSDAVLTVAQENSTLQGTALHLAVEQGSLGIVKALLDDGANPNAPMTWVSGNHEFRGTALHAAAVLKHVEIVRALLKAGANTGIPTNDGQTAADLARSGGAHHLGDLLDAEVRNDR